MKQKKHNTTKRNDTRIDILMAENGYRKDVDLARDLGMSPQALYNKQISNIKFWKNGEEEMTLTGEQYEKLHNDIKKSINTNK